MDRIVENYEIYYIDVVDEIKNGLDRKEVCDKVGISIDVLKSTMRYKNTTFKKLSKELLGFYKPPSKKQREKRLNTDYLKYLFSTYSSINQIYKNEKISSRVLKESLLFLGFINAKHFINENNINPPKIKKVVKGFKKGHVPSNKLFGEDKKEAIEKAKINRKKWREENRELINKKRKEKYHNNPSFKIAANLRKRLSFLLRYRLNKKSEQTLDLLGCKFEDFLLHLSNKFKEGMSFDNYGKWHIDHIIPCYNFDLSLREEREKCFHYTNLQPLWAQENLSKNRF